MATNSERLRWSLEHVAILEAFATGDVKPNKAQRFVARVDGASGARLAQCRQGRGVACSACGRAAVDRRSLPRVVAFACLTCFLQRLSGDDGQCTDTTHAGLSTGRVAARRRRSAQRVAMCRCLLWRCACAQRATAMFFGPICDRRAHTPPPRRRSPPRVRRRCRFGFKTCARTRRRRIPGWPTRPSCRHRCAPPLLAGCVVGADCARARAHARNASAARWRARATSSCTAKCSSTFALLSRRASRNFCSHRCRRVTADAPAQASDPSKLNELGDKVFFYLEQAIDVVRRVSLAPRL